MDYLKKGKVGAVCFQKAGEEKEICFEEIFLNKGIRQGEVWVTGDAFNMAGGINHLLKEGKLYELLLRISVRYRIILVDRKKKSEYLHNGETWKEMQLDFSDPGLFEKNAWKTECYIIGRYKKELLKRDYFNDAVMGVISAGGSEGAGYLEQMLTGSEEYYRLYDYTQPVLIYVGEELCYQVLDGFARSIGRALQEAGCHVIYFNTAKQKPEEITAYIGMRLKAVIGMQTYMFSLKRKDGNYVHDMIGAPEYHFIFDHPVWLRNHLLQGPKRMTILTPDANYAAFAEKYYNHRAGFFPPAGQEQYYGRENRQYDISFLGTYADSLLDDLKELRRNDRKKAYMVSRYLLYMRKNITSTPEKELENLLHYYQIDCTKEEFEELFASVRWVSLKLAHYYRRKTVELLLKAGFLLHVFGDSWKSSPLCKYKNLICHEQAVGEQALRVYGNSKLALNIMTWHKNGFTERIANAMLQKAVVVTDWTAYLEKNFMDGKELVVFRLNDLKDLPRRIAVLLDDDIERRNIAKNGYEKAVKEHTWRRRAMDLLTIMKEDAEKRLFEK